MTVPTLDNFQRRRSRNIVAGQPRYVNTPEYTEYFRSSPIAETSAPIPIGVAVAFTGVIDAATGVQEVQAIDTPGYTFVADDFAGFTMQVHEDRLDRASIPDLTSDPNVYSNIFQHQPKDMCPRWTFKSIWIRTDLTVAPVRGEAVQILPNGQVSNAGGVALTGVIFTSELDAGWDGNQYACVNIVTPLVA